MLPAGLEPIPGAGTRPDGRVGFPVPSRSRWQLILFIYDKNMTESELSIDSRLCIRSMEGGAGNHEKGQ